MITAITILATEASDYIKNLFVDKEIQDSGKYTMRIFFYNDPKIIVLDDYFPCYTYTVFLFICSLIQNAANY